MLSYEISGLIFKINAPEWTLHDNLRTFLCNGKYAEEAGNPLCDEVRQDADVYCKIVFEKRDKLPLENTMLVVKAKGTSIYKSDGYLYNLSGEQDDIPSCIVYKEDISECTLYIDPDYDNPNNENIIQCVREGILAALKNIMIAILIKKQGLLIHSSSILFDNKAILFSAPSGTGKTTHASLWKQYYDTPILDGDVAACRVVNGRAFAYGLPWCGTSNEFMNRSAPLGAIFFLQQAKENSIIKLNLHEAFIRLISRCFILPWDEKMTSQIMDIVQRVAASVDCYILNCLPDREAVELVKNTIESNWRG